jgi:hypothetical protein
VVEAWSLLLSLSETSALWSGTSALSLLPGWEPPAKASSVPEEEEEVEEEEEDPSTQLPSLCPTPSLRELASLELLLPPWPSLKAMGNSWELSLPSEKSWVETQEPEDPEEELPSGCCIARARAVPAAAARARRTELATKGRPAGRAP